MRRWIRRQAHALAEELLNATVLLGLMGTKPYMLALGLVLRTQHAPDDEKPQA